MFETLPGPSQSRDLSMDFETALEKLPDGAREIFVLHDVEGYKHHEIGTLLGISAGTSKAQLHRARMMLRRHLRPGIGAARGLQMANDAFTDRLSDYIDDEVSRRGASPDRRASSLCAVPDRRRGAP